MSSVKRSVCVIGACAFITMLLLVRSASAINFIFIDNGVSGDGFWQVRTSEGGSTTIAKLDPTGSPGGISGTTQIIFQYFHYVDVGADGGGVILHNTAITTPANLTDTDTNEVTSAGLFEGDNGTISWTAVSFIEPGSPLYLTELTFTSDNPFGRLRLIQYLDQDVEFSTDDVLIPMGTPGADDFQPLTVDDNILIGVSHSATYNTAVGMTYIGWAADKWPHLRDTIQGAGAAYSIPGEVDTTDLPEIIGGDSRFPGLPAFGPADISSAIAFDLDPEATFASVILALGGSLAGEPPPVPPVPEPATSVPETSTLPVDIKPQSCPNPLNVNSKGVLPVAILGTEDFDASQIDPESVYLAGVAPLRWAWEDVTTPYEPYNGKENEYDCTTEGPDGYTDLTLKFDTQEIVDGIEMALEVEVKDGDVMILGLGGYMMQEFGGTLIEGEDVVLILKKGKGNVSGTAGGKHKKR